MLYLRFACCDRIVTAEFLNFVVVSGTVFLFALYYNG